MVLWHPLLFPLAVLYTCVGAQANRRGRKWKRGICIKKSLFADTFSNPKNKQCISPSPSLPLLQVSGQFYWTQILIWFDLKGVACWGCEVRCLKGPKSHQVPVSLGDNGLPGLRERSWWEGCSPLPVPLRAMGGRKGWFTHPPYSGWQRPPKSLNASVWVRVALPDRGLGSVIYTLVWGQA